MSVMAMVYQAGLNNGLSPNQARAFTAEVGRENDFNPNFIFGEHRDSNRNNVGIISWNQGRRDNLYSFLKKKGIKVNGRQIERSQRALDAQMQFAIQEMKTNPSYSATKKVFLDNPNVDYRTAEKVLGKNFIRWDYAGNSLGANVRKHHAKRDKYYQQLGGVVQNSRPQQQADPRLSMSAPQLLATLRKGNDKRTDLQILYELSNNNGKAGREIKQLMAQGESLNDIASQLGLKVPSSQPQAAQQAIEPPSFEQFAAENMQPTEPPSFEEFAASNAEPMEAPSFEDFSASYEQEQPQEPVEPPSFEQFAASYEPTEQPTQAGDTWQTQKISSDSMLSEKNGKALPTQKSSWESPS